LLILAKSVIRHTHDSVAKTWSERPSGFWQRTWFGDRFNGCAHLSYLSRPLWLSGTRDGDPRLRSAADCHLQARWLETTADRCNLPKWLAAAPYLLGMPFARAI